MGFCIHCDFAKSFWFGPDGRKRTPPPSSFGDMNIYCHHPKKGAGRGQSFPVWRNTCPLFKRAETDATARRCDFFAQFDKSLIEKLKAAENDSQGV